MAPVKGKGPDKTLLIHGFRADVRHHLNSLPKPRFAIEQLRASMGTLSVKDTAMLMIHAWDYRDIMSHVPCC